MLKYIIRLDDACPTMHEENWKKVEKILDKYNIKPIVGVIPENKDSEFNHKEIKDFWKKYPIRWQEKGWIIAVHGCYHKYGYHKTLFKRIRTEFTGKSYDEQNKLISDGYNILKEKGVNATCFFAPNHTFDNTTVKVCKDLGCFEFISDGYAFFPYKNKGMLFLPSVFDTPHKVSKKGIFTFVYHPTNITEEKLKYLEEFIKQNREEFDVDLNEIVTKYKNRKRSIKDYLLQFAIYSYRKVRMIIKGK